MRLLATTPGALAAALAGPGRAGRVFGVLRRGGDPFDGSLGPRATERLRAAVAPTPVSVRSRTTAADGTVKLLIAFEDGRAVESVLIPTARRSTACISAQVGCARGCCFCATASMGLVRNLQADEIVAQVVLAIALAGELGAPPLRNLVLMGMGEPLDNLEEVARALAVIASEAGLAFSPRHVTVSTVAPSPEKVRAAGSLPADLAWSLHSADDEIRRRLVPTARAEVRALRDAFADVCSASGRPIFVEVALIDGVNDTVADADRIAALLSDFPTEVRVNLLPMNPIAGSALAPSRGEAVLAVEARLRAAGLFVMVRKARGGEERAACGQLAVLESRRKGAAF